MHNFHETKSLQLSGNFSRVQLKFIHVLLGSHQMKLYLFLITD